MKKVAAGANVLLDRSLLTDPQASADARGIDNGIAQCPEILRLGGERCWLRFLRQQVPVPPRQHAAPSPSRLYPIIVPPSPGKSLMRG
jgi:hypothetical protein